MRGRRHACSMGAYAFVRAPVPETMTAHHPFSLQDRVALVTGAYRGLGLAIARGLAQAGATVVLNGRKPDALAQAVQTLRKEGLEASMCLFDVADRTAVPA